MEHPPPGALELSREDVEALVVSAGQPRYRADQILAWIHARGVLAPDEMTDLPKALREALRERWSADPGGAVAASATAADGTMRLDLALADGQTTQTVLIPEAEEEPEDDDSPSPPRPTTHDSPPTTPDAQPTTGALPPTTHDSPPTTVLYTQCLSTQVGCAFGCAFCRSGSRGFVRHLTAGEILVQRHRAREALAGRGVIVRTVVMGIGEPLHNLDALLRALHLLVDPRGGRVSPRRITVSTIGLPDGIRALGAAFGGRVGLAWSLHAADEETRRILLPAASRRPVTEVVRALREYPLPPRSRITVECVLVGGINDSVRHARGVVRLLEGLRCKVNLIPFNPWLEPGPTTHDAQRTTVPCLPPAPDAVLAYQETLAASGLSAFVRKPRGADVLAACGQLLGAADLSSGGRWDS